MPATLHEKTIRGLKTSWWQSGSTSPQAPIAILFHGFPDSPDTWLPLIEDLEKQYLVVRPFLRGAGPSEATEELSRYRLDAAVLDYLEVLHTIDPLGSRPVTVFGHDIGASIAWELACALRDRASALVLIAGMGLEIFWNRRFRSDQHRRSWYMYLMQVPGGAEALFRWFGPEIVRKAYEVGGLKQAPSWESLQDCVPGLIPYYRALLRDALQRQTNQDSPRLQVPTLVLWGNRDPFLVSVESSEWRQFASRVDLRVLEAGHWPHREKPEQVNRLVKRFLNELEESHAA